MERPTIRPYTLSDKEAVLQLLRLNTPQYFSPEEEPDFIYFLENEIEYYFVVEINQQIVGCGGINFPKTKTIGTLSWDIVDPAFQGRKLGNMLVNHRIQLLKTRNDIHHIRVRTSQLTYAFYEKSGFRIIEIQKDYWAKGFDLYNMEYIQ